MRQNVPWIEAWEMEPGRRRACVIYYGELDGRSYDFDRMCWREPET